MARYFSEKVKKFYVKKVSNKIFDKQASPICTTAKIKIEIKLLQTY